MITCECGHGIEEHSEFGCEYPPKSMWSNCDCTISKDTIEARYWARRMMKERDEALVEVKDIQHGFDLQHRAALIILRHRDALQSRLDIAVKGLEWYAISPMISGDAVARVTLAKIRKE